MPCVWKPVQARAMIVQTAVWKEGESAGLFSFYLIVRFGEGVQMDGMWHGQKGGLLKSTSIFQTTCRERWNRVELSSECSTVRERGRATTARANVVWSVLQQLHWFSHAGIQSFTHTHTHIHTHTHTCRSSIDHLVDPLLERLKLKKPNSYNQSVCYSARIQNVHI